MEMPIIANIAANQQIDPTTRLQPSESKLISSGAPATFESLLKSPAVNAEAALNVLNDMNNVTLKVGLLVKVVDQSVVGVNKLLNMS